MVIAVYTTLGSNEEARDLAQAVIANKLAACAQISEIESFFVWEDEVQNEPEWRVVFKTTKAAYEELEIYLKAYHPYDEPQIYAVEIVAGSQGYLDWVVASVSA